MFNARFKLRKRILLSDRCEPSMLTEVSRNTHRNIPHATFAVVHDRIVISNAPDSCPLKNPLAPYILPGPVETGGQQGQLPPPHHQILVELKVRKSQKETIVFSILSKMAKKLLPLVQKVVAPKNKGTLYY